MQQLAMARTQELRGGAGHLAMQKHLNESHFFFFFKFN